MPKHIFLALFTSNHLQAYISFCLVLTLLILSVNSSCIEKLLSNKKYYCGKTSSLDSSSLDFPSMLLKGTEEFSVQVSLKINDMCSSGYPFNLFTLKYSPNGTEVDVTRIQIAGLHSLLIYNEDSTGNRGGYSSSSVANYTEDFSMEFYLSFNLTAGYNRLYDATTTTNTYISFYGNYTGWKFDRTLRFLFCTDDFGMTVASCTIEVLALENQYNYFSTYRSAFDYLGGVEPVLIASYTFNQKSGTKIKNSINGQLGPAEFGTGLGKAPRWIKDEEAGVEFTNPNQYISIPTFVPKAGTFQTPICFTVNFWVKIKNETNSGFIFRYSRSNMSQALFSISIVDYQYLQLIIGPRQYKIYAIVPFEVWNRVTTSFVCYSYSTYCTSLTYLNGTAVYRSYFSVPREDILPFEASDVVLLGGPNGFKGKIANLKIFNPGSQRLTTPTCGTSAGCKYAIGAFESTNKNCLQCQNFYSDCKICPAGYYASGLECIEEEKTFPGEAASKGAAGAAKAATQAVSAVSSGSSAGASAAISGKVFSNIKFIKISYSDDLENALTTWKSNYFSLGFDIKIPVKLERRLVNASVPEIFAKHQVNSCFLVNFWEPLIMLILSILLLLVVLGLNFAMSQWTKKDRSRIQLRILPRVKVMILNFLIVQLYGMYGDIVFYGMIEFRSTKVTAGINFLSSIAAVLLLIAMILGFFLHINLLKRYQNVRKNFGGQNLDRFITDHESIQVIFGDFKDQSLVHQSFLLVFTIRDILLSVILTTLFDYPLTECVLILLMNIAMLLYLFIKRPFKDFLGQAQQVVLELITLAVNVSILVLAILDKRELEAHHQRNKIGKFLIITNMIFNFVTVFFMVLCLSWQGYEIYSHYKRGQRDKKQIKLKTSRNIINLQNVTSVVHIDGRNSKTRRENISEASLKTISFWKNPQQVLEQSLDSSGTINSFRNNSQIMLREPTAFERRSRKWRKRKAESEQ